LLTLTRFQPFVDSSIFGRLGPAAFTQPRLHPAAGASSFKPKRQRRRVEFNITRLAAVVAEQFSCLCELLHTSKSCVAAMLVQPLVEAM
jgi:hypothetical protein